MQARARQMVAQIMKESDVDGLRTAIEEMSSQADNMPPAMKPMMDLMMKKMQERIAQLEKQKD
jgi:hypothetical protein